MGRYIALHTSQSALLFETHTTPRGPPTLPSPLLAAAAAAVLCYTDLLLTLGRAHPRAADAAEGLPAPLEHILSEVFRCYEARSPEDLMTLLLRRYRCAAVCWVRSCCRLLGAGAL